MKIRLRVVLAFVALIALVLAIACTSTDTGTKYDGTGITSGYGAGGGVTPNTATHDNTPPPTNTTGTSGTTGTTSTTST
jgi:hypothetical protein